MQKTLTTFLLILTIALSGCSYIRFPGVYKIDIGQGNIIKEEDIAKLKPGMSKRQVRYVLGEPLIKDPFHPDRWDYFYSLKPGKKPITQKHFLVYFENDQLIESLGDCCTAEELEKDLKVVPGERPKEGAESTLDENDYSSIKLPRGKETASREDNDNLSIKTASEEEEASREENGYSDIKERGEIEPGEGVETTREENEYSDIREREEK